MYENSKSELPESYPILQEDPAYILHDVCRMYAGSYQQTALVILQIGDAVTIVVVGFGLLFKVCKTFDTLNPCCFCASSAKVGASKPVCMIRRATSEVGNLIIC